jgi:excisionase family DNA binding protein
MPAVIASEISQNVFTLKELAAYLKMSHEFLELHVYEQRIPGMFKVGRCWRFKRAEIEKQIALHGQVLLPKKGK